MITYTEKGYGLHEAINAQGHWLMQIDGIWTSSDDQAVQAIIDSFVQIPDHPILTRPQFEYLLALSGFEDLWTLLEGRVKGVNTPLYAVLRGSRSKEFFRFEVVMGMIESFRPYLPEAAGLTETTLLPMWMEAAAFV